MQRSSILAIALLAGAATLQFATIASGESGGWVTLLDSTDKGEWSEVGKANWAMKETRLASSCGEMALPADWMPL